MVKNFRLLKNAKYSELFGKFGRLAFNPIRGSGMTKGGSVRDRSVTMMLLAIVGIFLCCNCLAFCNNIYEIVRDTRAHIESNVTHIEPSKSINGVAITTAMVAQRALELSFLPDEAGAQNGQARKPPRKKLMRGITVDTEAPPPEPNVPPPPSDDGDNDGVEDPQRANSRRRLIRFKSQ
ncbi:hypothetical protein TELCIR_18170 [Teladorsagia circumcincta]|uniref:Uncharacterized protein n=1 Tax=Teladorsagia circumcincta TaxID=45464 RepID=A0A2G9TQX5_TELCI|nr:hypothetical protein TELCIR_18170 [Teladorsagia circumcincta]